MVHPNKVRSFARACGYEANFASVEEYLLYYNTERAHQGLEGKRPLQTLELLLTN